jgi:hypothetical protein
MDTKTTGYIFLMVGLIIMTFSLILVILAFTNVIKPSYFKTSSVIPENKSTQSLGNDFSALSGNPEISLQNLMPSLNILPPGMLDNLLNLSTHFFLMTFVGGFGYKLSMIGVNLIRPIVVKTGNRTLEPS